MQPGVAQERPPYVTFETRAEEDREKSTDVQKAYKDVDYAFITPMGSKDRVERVASEWFANLRDQVQQGRFKAEWLAAYKSVYDAWKNDQELPENGTRLRDWPGLTPAQIKMATDLRLRTVEDLAAANEETVMRLGMGGRTLKQKAQDWLQVASGSASVAEESSRMRVDLEQLKQDNLAMAAQIKEQTALITQLSAAKAK